MKRSCASGYLQSAGSTGAVLLGSTAFTLNSLPGYTEYTNLFDQYRIKKVMVQCFPRQIDSVGDGGPNSIFSWATDHTDVTAPTQESDVLQYDGHKTLQAYKPFNMVINPAPAAAYWQGLTATGYGPRNGAWIDCKSPAVQHYGIKYAWNNNSNPVDYIDLYTTYWVEFREPQ